MSFLDLSIPEDILDLKGKDYKVISVPKPLGYDEKVAPIYREEVDNVYRERVGGILGIFEEIGSSLARKVNAFPLEENPETRKLVPTGNISIARNLYGYQGYFITGSGKKKIKPDLDDLAYVVKVDYQKGEIYTIGGEIASSENLLHYFIRLRAAQLGFNANIVAHIHDEDSRDAALLENGQPVTQTNIAFATARQALAVANLVDADHPYVHLRNHGQVIVAQDIRQLIDLAVSENLRAQTVLTRARQMEANLY